MKVNDRNRGVLDPRVSELGGIAPDGGAGAPGGVGEADQVSVSETARELARLKAEVGDPNAVDEYRVATLRALTAEGRWAPDLRATAEALLRHVVSDLVA
ncbi:MAG TPA: flagellar biosynthesis anti-sigma factor FlgM [Candidatus Binatia bacterium]|jgi:flagellar biosynthesis anti-sigma factor FlgM|nr:flagellar biosynthesis anti-sigma factor FlgM [Candidatus Binatia bacterium]